MQYVREDSDAQIALRGPAEWASADRRQRGGEFDQSNADAERAYELAQIYHGIDADAAKAMAAALPRGYNWSATRGPVHQSEQPAFNPVEAALEIALFGLDEITRGYRPVGATMSHHALETATRARAQARTQWRIGLYASPENVPTEALAFEAFPGEARANAEFYQVPRAAIRSTIDVWADDSITDQAEKAQARHAALDSLLGTVATANGYSDLVDMMHRLPDAGERVEPIRWGKDVPPGRIAEVEWSCAGYDVSVASAADALKELGEAAAGEPRLRLVEETTRRYAVTDDRVCPSATTPIRPSPEQVAGVAAVAGCSNPYGPLGGSVQVTGHASYFDTGERLEACLEGGDYSLDLRIVKELGRTARALAKRLGPPETADVTASLIRECLRLLTQVDQDAPAEIAEAAYP